MKASSSQQSNDCPSSQDILESFAKCQKLKSPRNQEESACESPRKRQKYTDSNISGEKLGERASDIRKMYTFIKNTPKGPEVIDLTQITPEPTEPASPNPYSPRKASNPINPSKFQTQKAAKKLVVKNLRKEHKSSPDNYCDQTWLQLDSALSAIFSGEEPSYSREELYRGVETACRQNTASVLYKKLCDKCREHTMGHLRNTMFQEMSKGGTAMLAKTVDTWFTWSNQMVIIRSIFYYMDRTYLLPTTSKATINELAIVQFRNLLLSDRKVTERVIKDTTDLIDAARHGETGAYDPDLLQKAISMFHELSIYSTEFEPKMIACSADFFKKWADEMMKPKRIAPYVKQCHDLIQEETKRCKGMNFEISTDIEVTKLLEQILISDRAQELVDTDLLFPLFEADDRKILHVLYLLLQRKQLGDKLRPAFESYISSQGSKIIFDEDREQEMVTRLLIFKRKLDATWDSSFEKHEGLGHSLREAFEGFINKTQKSSMTWGTDNPKPGEMIAKYVDVILKGGSKAIPTANGTELRPAEDEGNEEAMNEDAHISRELDQVLDMFRFVHGKAVFEAFYKRDLARRLLMGRSASSDAEKSMLTRLRSGMFV